MNQSKKPYNFDDLPIIEQKDCHFHVKLNGYFYEFEHGSVVTNQIFRIGLNVKLRPKTTVSLCYYDRDIDCCVKAEVLDCYPSENYPFLISFRLYPDMEDKNSLFLMAMRNYLDNFDHYRLAD